MKQVLCKSCRLYELAVLVGGKHARVIEECYFPANEKKAGTATECNEYEAKKTDVS